MRILVEKGREYDPRYLFEAIRDRIAFESPGFEPFLALFGCSDEVQSATDEMRASVFSSHGGIFSTRIIGSQIFYQQVKVALGQGHRSNVFEVNVHIGETREGGRVTRGRLCGRDGVERPTCGALTHVVEDFRAYPDETPSISSTENGILFIDFLGSLKYRLHARRAEILAAESPIESVTRMNLEVQVRELVGVLERFLAADPSLGPLYVLGTVTVNRVEMPDTEILERFLKMDGTGATELI